VSGYQYVFPRDHASHDEFRTEWWYYTGHLRAEDGREFGYQLTFFRQGIDDEQVRKNPSRWAVSNVYLAHAAVSHHGKERFRYSEKVSRAGLGKAGAESARLHVWIDRWSVEAISPDHLQHRLRVSSEEVSFDLIVVSEKPPVVHGADGISRKGHEAGQASHYYSLTRLRTSGTLVVDHQPIQVHGVSWMDHEFGSGGLGRDQVGWDWFSIQLDDGRDVMFYRLRRTDGTADPVSSGTAVAPEGTVHHLFASDVSVDVLDEWTSPVSGARYPHRWRFTVPSMGLVLMLIPMMHAQELVTERSTHVTYWEGAVRITGDVGGTPIVGHGYVELTGYARRFAALP
jgi:predicted secreted hydrolase